MEKITDEEVLTDIAIHDHNYDISRMDGPQNFKFYFYNRENAFVKIKNKVMLSKIARESQHILENIKYIDQFIDSEDEWLELVLNAKSIDVRLYSLARIRSQDSFLRIVEECDDEGIKKLAGRNINRDEPDKSE